MRVRGEECLLPLRTSALAPEPSPKSLLPALSSSASGPQGPHQEGPLSQARPPPGRLSRHVQALLDPSFPGRRVSCLSHILMLRSHFWLIEIFIPLFKIWLQLSTFNIFFHFTYPCCQPWSRLDASRLDSQYHFKQKLAFRSLPRGTKRYPLGTSAPLS